MGKLIAKVWVGPGENIPESCGIRLQFSTTIVMVVMPAVAVNLAVKRRTTGPPALKHKEELR